MKNVLTLARREFKGYFDHPTAYILIVAFLALGLFLAFRTLYSTGMADLRAFFDYLPWLFAVFIPAITMRSLAEERGRGTLEWLMSQPMTEMELVLGKCLGNWMFALVALAGTLPTAFGLLMVSDADWGPMAAQYVGGALLAFQMVGLGLLASAATRNQITAFILASVLAFVLVLSGLQIVLVGLPPVLANVVTQLSIPPHFAGMSRGVIDLRDVLYFLTTGALFLVGAYFLVVRLRLSRSRGAYRRLRIGTLALAVGVLVLNLLGSEIRGRLDWTEDDLYTLSQGTRQILSELDDVVTIRLFVSRELPPEISLTRRDVEDLLADFRRYSDGNLQLEVVNPDEDEDAASEAQSLGIRQIQFNVLREDEFQVRRGWFGLAVLYADQQEVIPVVSRSDDLEYRLASAISAMTSEGLPLLGYVTDFGARAPSSLSLLDGVLADRYEAVELSLTPDGAPADSTDAGVDGAAAEDGDGDPGGSNIPGISPDTVDVLLVIGPTETFSQEAADTIASYLDRGGSALFLLDRVLLEPQRAVTVPFETGLESLLADRGVIIQADLVADYQSNQVISLGQQGGFGLVRNYPLWPIVLPSSDHTVTRGLERITLAWPSALEVTDTRRVTPLWATTEYADLLRPGQSVQPDQLPQPDPAVLSRRVVAAAVEERVAAGAPPGGDALDGVGSGEGAGEEPGGRLVVVGDADFLTPQIAQGSGQNVTFVANAVDWLAQDESLIAIRSKDRTPAPLVFDSDFQRMALRWGNLVGMPLVFVLVGLVRGLRRRQDAQRIWQEIQS